MWLAKNMLIWQYYSTDWLVCGPSPLCSVHHHFKAEILFIANLKNTFWNTPVFNKIMHTCSVFIVTYNIMWDICICVCVYLCFFCFTLRSCCIVVSTVGWTWWDWNLIFWTYLPSMLWHCWLGHLTSKNPSPIWPICVWWDVKPYSVNQS